MSDDHSTVAASRKCLEKIDNASSYDVTETVHTDYEVIKDVSCTENGLVRYFAPEFKNSAFKDVNAEIEVETEKLPHNFGAPVWEWTQTSDGYDVSAKFVCTECSETEEYKATVTRVIEGNNAIYTAEFTRDDERYVSVLRAFASDVRENPTVSFVKGNEAVKLSWNKVNGAEKYGIAGYVGGKWNMDFSNAVVVTPNEAEVSDYPVVTSAVKGGQFRLAWTAVDNAESYTVAAYINGSWKTIAVTNADTLKYTSPAGNTPAGTYYVAVVAKVNGKWDTTNIKSRAEKITI